MKHPEIWNSVQTLLKFRNQAPLLKPGKIQDKIPLSFPQERLWAMDRLHPGSFALNVPYGFRVKGKLNIVALEQTLNEIRQRHEILRTNFKLVDGQPLQVVAPVQKYKLDLLDIQESAEKEFQILQLATKEAQKPFDLSKDSLLRTTLLKLGTEDYLLLFTCHHIIWDAWSGGVFLRELGELYQAFSSGKPSPLPQPSLQYSDFAIWQRQWLQGEFLNSLLSYWKQQLQDLPKQKLPVDYVPVVASRCSSSRQDLVLSKSLTEKLKALTDKEGVTLFITLLAAFEVLLRSYMGQEDLFICTPIANRNQKETQQLLGYFVNLVIQRTNLSGNPSFQELLNRVRKGSSGAYAHQDLPLQELVNHLSLVQVPLSQVLFSLENSLPQNLKLGDLSVTFLEEQRGSDFDLFLSMEETNGELTAVLKYKTDLFHEETISQMLQNFQKVLEGIVANPEHPIDKLLPLRSKEPEAIETALKQHPNVKESIVFEEENLPGYQYLVAYIVPTPEQVPELDELRSFLKQKLPNYMLPSVLFTIEEMPLKADGTIDREALASLNRVRQKSGETYIPPNTLTERKLVTIWGKVLWLDREIGINENFFELGGHSLLAVRLIAEIETTFNRKVPLTLLSQLSTIEQLAKILSEEITEESTQTELPSEIYNQLLAYTAGWQGTRVKSNSLIVGVNTNGTKQPLFWCFNSFAGCSQLAKCLGVDQPIYGMRSYSGILDPAEYNKDNIKALAAHYVSEILTIQPEQPYLLGGSCQGAWIIWEVAQQLVDRGKTVTLLCIAQKHTLQEYSGRIAFFFQRESDPRFNPYKHFYSPELGWRKFYSGGFSIDMLPGSHDDRQIFQAPLVQIFAQKLNDRIEQAQSVIPQLTPEKYQLLSLEAYRAVITTKPSLSVPCDDTVLISVVVKNISSVTWQSTPYSAIKLANHWMNEAQEVIQWIDGTTDLTRDLHPGEEIEITVSVNTPTQAGCYFLELDLVEDGVTWFKERGSTTTLVTVEVIPAESILDGQDYDFYYCKGNEYFEKGNAELAIINYQKAIKSSSETSVKLYQNLGDCFSQLQQWHEAIAPYTEAIKLEPNNSYVYFRLGEVRAKQGKLDEAISNLQKSLDLESNNSTLLQNIGDICYKLKKFKPAKAAYQKSLKLRENGKFVHDMYGKLGMIELWQGNIESAISYLEKSLEIFFDEQRNLKGYLLLGKLQNRIGNFVAATTAYKQAVKLQPKNPDVYVALGDTQVKLEDVSSAIISYEKAIELNPQQSFKVYQKLGDALNKKGDLKQAITAYEQAINLNPENLKIQQRLFDTKLKVRSKDLIEQ